MRRRITAFLLVITILLFAGCKGPEVKEVTPTTKNEVCTIGLSFDSFVIERWTRDRDVFVSTANELGAEVNVQSAGGDVATQISHIKLFIERGVDAIVIITADANALSDIVKEASDKGIPVICYDRLVMNAGADLYISFDNESVGRQMAEAICANVEDGGNIVEIMGPESDYNVPQVMNGFDAVCEEHGMNITLKYNCDNWKPELAYDFVNEHFDEIAGADAIMCGNDALAGETIHALAERGYAGRIFVTGQDGDLEACQRLVEGTQLVTVYKPVEKLARLAAECAVKLASGESLGQTELFFDGGQDIPYIAIEPSAVTIENLDSIIIDSGFHLREEVYMNAG
ncbi:substrate-binding domain-containing protein [Butyrivibrio sp. AE2032]|uniref:substrate-binding domain-containing protein n=1 Tax=Butyrivibrio sp. AE2032 TaxID=1458463 RepID=UPI0005523FD2|nr:substrate-binding domain-containing protein [Butyrivibrio sp. AE2032]